jgi:hypothetical protein
MAYKAAETCHMATGEYQQIIVVNTIATATAGVSQLTWCELRPQILVYTTNRVSVAVADGLGVLSL